MVEVIVSRLGLDSATNSYVVDPAGEGRRRGCSPSGSGSPRPSRSCMHMQQREARAPAHARSLQEPDRRARRRSCGACRSRGSQKSTYFAELHIQRGDDARAHRCAAVGQHRHRAAARRADLAPTIAARRAGGRRRGRERTTTPASATSDEPRRVRATDGAQRRAAQELPREPASRRLREVQSVSCASRVAWRAARVAASRRCAVAAAPVARRRAARASPAADAAPSRRRGPRRPADVSGRGRRCRASWSRCIASAPTAGPGRLGAHRRAAARYRVPLPPLAATPTRSTSRRRVYGGIAYFTPPLRARRRARRRRRDHRVRHHVGAGAASRVQGHHIVVGAPRPTGVRDDRRGLRALERHDRDRGRAATRCAPVWSAPLAARARRTSRAGAGRRRRDVASTRATDASTLLAPFAPGRQAAQLHLLARRRRAFPLDDPARAADARARGAARGAGRAGARRRRCARRAGRRIEGRTFKRFLAQNAPAASACASRCRPPRRAARSTRGRWRSPSALALRDGRARSRVALPARRVGAARVSPPRRATSVESLAARDRRARRASRARRRRRSTRRATYDAQRARAQGAARRRACRVGRRAD